MKTLTVSPGDVIEAIDDTPLHDLPGVAVNALVEASPLGERVPVTCRGPRERRIEVLVEDLLPSYPPPGSNARSRRPRRGPGGAS